MADHTYPDQMSHTPSNICSIYSNICFIYNPQRWKTIPPAMKLRRKPHMRRSQCASPYQHVELQYKATNAKGANIATMISTSKPNSTPKPPKPRPFDVRPAAPSTTRGVPFPNTYLVSAANNVVPSSTGATTPTSFCVDSTGRSRNASTHCAAPGAPSGASGRTRATSPTTGTSSTMPW
jgi:hypothetical protein